MKIYSNQADKYIRDLTLHNNGIAALIYGPDQGAVRNYRNKIIIKFNANNDFEVIDFSAEQIKHDPSILSIEINSPSFFSRRKILTIDGVNAAVAEAINQALHNISSELIILITADELGKESKLRNSFENHKYFPTIICYKEDIRSIKSLITDKFKQENVRLEPATLEFLSSNLGDDKQVTLNEIEKIMIYLGEQKTLSFNEVSELLADNSELTLNDITYNVSMKIPFKLEKSLNKAFAEHVSMIAIVRSCYAHFQKLTIVQNNISHGINAETALKNLRPPIFFKQIDQFKASLSKWNIQQLNATLNRLLNLELALKAGNINSELICHKELLSLAS